MSAHSYKVASHPDGPVEEDTKIPSDSKTLMETENQGK